MPHGLTTLSYIGAGFCSGQGLNGADITPDLLRRSHLPRLNKNWTLRDCGDIDFPSHWQRVKKKLPDPDDVNANDCHLNGECNRKVSEIVQREAKFNDRFVLTVGGDHSIGFGTIHGVLKARPNTCVIWVDAHADSNTPITSKSGNMHGMPAAGLLGMYDFKKLPGWSWFDPVIDKNDIVFIAIRDLDDQEREMLKRENVHVFTMFEIDKYGIGEVMKRALIIVNPHNTRPIHLTFDIDSCDPAVAPSTGTVCNGGLSFREAHFVCEYLAQTGCLTSMDLVEINPFIVEGAKAHQGSKVTMNTEDLSHSQGTLDFGWGLVESSLGSRIM